MNTLFQERENLSFRFRCFLEIVECAKGMNDLESSKKKLDYLFSLCPIEEDKKLRSPKNLKLGLTGTGSNTEITEFTEVKSRNFEFLIDEEQEAILSLGYFLVITKGKYLMKSITLILSNSLERLGEYKWHRSGKITPEFFSYNLIRICKELLTVAPETCEDIIPSFIYYLKMTKNAMTKFSNKLFSKSRNFNGMSYGVFKALAQGIILPTESKSKNSNSEVICNLLYNFLKVFVLESFNLQTIMGLPVAKKQLLLRMNLFSLKILYQLIPFITDKEKIDDIYQNNGLKHIHVQMIIYQSTHFGRESDRNILITFMQLGIEISVECSIWFLKHAKDEQTHKVVYKILVVAIGMLKKVKNRNEVPEKEFVECILFQFGKLSLELNSLSTFFGELFGSLEHFYMLQAKSKSKSFDDILNQIENSIIDMYFNEKIRDDKKILFLRKDIIERIILLDTHDTTIRLLIKVLIHNSIEHQNQLEEKEILKDDQVIEIQGESITENDTEKEMSYQEKVNEEILRVIKEHVIRKYNEKCLTIPEISLFAESIFKGTVRQSYKSLEFVFSLYEEFVISEYENEEIEKEKEKGKERFNKKKVFESFLMAVAKEKKNKVLLMHILRSTLKKFNLLASKLVQECKTGHIFQAIRKSRRNVSPISIFLKPLAIFMKDVHEKGLKIEGDMLMEFRKFWFNCVIFNFVEEYAFPDKAIFNACSEISQYSPYLVDMNSTRTSIYDCRLIIKNLGLSNLLEKYPSIEDEFTVSLRQSLIVLISRVNEQNKRRKNQNLELDLDMNTPFIETSGDIHYLSRKAVSLLGFEDKIYLLSLFHLESLRIMQSYSLDFLGVYLTHGMLMKNEGESESLYEVQKLLLRGVFSQWLDYVTLLKQFQEIEHGCYTLLRLLPQTGKLVRREIRVSYIKHFFKFTYLFHSKKIVEYLFDVLNDIQIENGKSKPIVFPRIAKIENSTHTKKVVLPSTVSDRNELFMQVLSLASLWIQRGYKLTPNETRYCILKYFQKFYGEGKEIRNHAGYSTLLMLVSPVIRNQEENTKIEKSDKYNFVDFYTQSLLNNFFEIEYNLEYSFTKDVIEWAYYKGIYQNTQKLLHFFEAKNETKKSRDFKEIHNKTFEFIEEYLKKGDIKGYLFLMVTFLLESKTMNIGVLQKLIWTSFLSKITSQKIAVATNCWTYLLECQPEIEELFWMEMKSLFSYLNNIGFSIIGDCSNDDDDSEEFKDKMKSHLLLINFIASRVTSIGFKPNNVQKSLVETLLIILSKKKNSKADKKINPSFFFLRIRVIIVGIVLSTYFSGGYLCFRLRKKVYRLGLDWFDQDTVWWAECNGVFDLSKEIKNLNTLISLLEIEQKSCKNWEVETENKYENTSLIETRSFRSLRSLALTENISKNAQINNRKLKPPKKKKINEFPDNSYDLLSLLIFLLNHEKHRIELWNSPRDYLKIIKKQNLTWKNMKYTEWWELFESSFFHSDSLCFFFFDRFLSRFTSKIKRGLKNDYLQVKIRKIFKDLAKKSQINLRSREKFIKLLNNKKVSRYLIVKEDAYSDLNVFFTLVDDFDENMNPIAISNSKLEQKKIVDYNILHWLCLWKGENMGQSMKYLIKGSPYGDNKKVFSYAIRSLRSFLKEEKKKTLFERYIPQMVQLCRINWTDKNYRELIMDIIRCNVIFGHKFIWQLQNEMIDEKNKVIGMSNEELQIKQNNWKVKLKGISKKLKLPGKKSIKKKKKNLNISDLMEKMEMSEKENNKDGNIENQGSNKDQKIDKKVVKMMKKWRQNIKKMKGKVKGDILSFESMNFAHLCKFIKNDIESLMDASTHEGYNEIFHFFSKFTHVRNKMLDVIGSSKAIKNQRLRKLLKSFKSYIPKDAYLPNNTRYVICGLDENGSTTLKSSKNLPILVPFEVFDKLEGPEGKKHYERLIFKDGDDVRMDQIAIQFIQEFDDIFKSSKMNLTMEPYQIIPTGPGKGIIEVIKNSSSVHDLKEKYELPMLEIFRKMFGNFEQEDFQKARQNFILSLAAYSVVTYFLNVKDRHNGNIMIDNLGRLLHIDFGFILEFGPGKTAIGTFTIENWAPFKFTDEMIEIITQNSDLSSGNISVDSSKEIMDSNILESMMTKNDKFEQSQAGKVSLKDTESYKHYTDLIVRTFLVGTERKGVKDIINLVTVLAKYCDLPCFGSDWVKCIQNLKSRFCFDKTEEERAQKMMDLLETSYQNWATGLYDTFQNKVENIKK